MDLVIVVQHILASFYEKYPFLTYTILGVPAANLIVAIFVLLFFLIVKELFTNTVIKLLQKLAKYTKNYYDDRIISALKQPIRFMFVITGLYLFVVLIFQGNDTTIKIINTLIVFTLFWAIANITEALKDILYNTAEKLNSDLSQEMGNFVLKILRVLIWAIGLGSILQVWGINVTALIASLGLGGLAFALAAKDTAANLFGSFAILADKSIRIGEWIKVDGVEGVVEDIGMRTTKIKTFEKSLITLPNQVLANSPIENFSRRGVRRIKMTIGITYSTTQEQLQQITSDILYLLKKHENIAQDETIMVNFASFGDSTLNIFIYCFTKTSNWKRYMDIKQEIQLKIMKIVEENNSSFAFPSQSIYVESLPDNNLL